MKPTAFFSLAKQAASEWSSDKAPTHGGALAYYTLFSIAPLLMITIGIAGMIFGEEAARGQIFDQLRGLVGEKGGKAMEEMLQNAHSQKGSSIAATIVGAVTLLFGASTVFGQLQASLNTVWGVEPKPGRGIKGVIKDRVLSFGIVLVIGFLLLVSLILTAMLAGIGKWMGGWVPGGELIAQSLNFVLSLGVITVLFAMIFKMLPDAIISWRDVWTGALITSLLFVLGKFALGMYLGKSSIASSFGAAGSLIVVVVWVYYSSQILIFGAEFTQVYANRFGSHVKPAANAVLVDANEKSASPNPAAAPAKEHIPPPIDKDPDDLRRELAASRANLSSYSADLKEKANLSRRLLTNMKRQPQTWIAAGAVVSLFVASRFPRPRRVEIRVSPPESETTKKGAFLLGTFNMFLGSFRPILSAYATRAFARTGK